MKFQTALLALVLANTSAQISVDTKVTPEEMVANLFGENSPFTASNVVLKGDKCAGIFINGQQSVPTTDFPNEGIVLSTGDPTLLAHQNSDKTSTSFRKEGDTDLSAIAGTRTGDACVLEFDLVCSLGLCPLEFEYVFGSDEYSLTKLFNDVFAWHLNGVNIAFLPGTTTAVSINTVNKNVNSQYFIDNNPVNGISPYPYFEANGFTTTLTASGVALPGTNKMKLAITDTADLGIDSWVLLQKNSFVIPTPPSVDPIVTPKCDIVGCMGNDKKVAVCHHASNKNYVSICISENALDTHLEQHGDSCGCCSPDLEPTRKQWCDELGTNDLFVAP